MLKKMKYSMSIFCKYMDENSKMHGEKGGDILIYDLNIPAEEIWSKMDNKEHEILNKIGWKIDDGAFILEIEK